MAEGLLSAAWSKSLKGIPYFDSSFIEKWLEKDGKVPKKVITRGYSNFCEGYIFDVEGKFKDVCIRRADFESLAVRQLKKTVQTSAMKHGINTEEEAASAYADSGDCNVFPAGIVINPSCPHLAASPDRRVYDPSENSPWGLLEIKCPIKDSISQLPYLKCVNGIYKLKKTHSYYYQIMGQMLLTGCEWVDFYVYCKSDFHLERVRFDAEFCATMKMKLDTFYFEYLLPELLKKAGA
ncbi:hypothetical protein ABFA07_015311 [Porites harrisoni]